MYWFSLLVITVTLLSGSVAQAASYQKTDGTIVDPIPDTPGGSSHYYGNDLEPNANLSGASLGYADLTDADLSNANLWDANLTDANLTNANLTDATPLVAH